MGPRVGAGDTSGMCPMGRGEARAAARSGSLAGGQPLRRLRSFCVAGTVVRRRASFSRCCAASIRLYFLRGYTIGVVGDIYLVYFSVFLCFWRAYRQSSVGPYSQRLLCSY